jgi:hypothetical protein
MAGQLTLAAMTDSLCIAYTNLATARNLVSDAIRHPYTYLQPMVTVIMRAPNDAPPFYPLVARDKERHFSLIGCFQSSRTALGVTIAHRLDLQPLGRQGWGPHLIGVQEPLAASRHAGVVAKRLSSH